MIAITGNTYPVKDQIKALGGRWNADRKAWMVPDDKADEARNLVAGAPASRCAKRRPIYSDGKVWSGHGKKCYNCGRRNCDGARGFLCEHD